MKLALKRGLVTAVASLAVVSGTAATASAAETCHHPAPVSHRGDHGRHHRHCANRHWKHMRHSGARGTGLFVVKGTKVVRSTTAVLRVR
ncbi:hypothetical protein K7472_28655 [Streptomyces sp. PTM05]|uniref:Secreted protein n=1 Tax=Streptantibioticus parmotrematis TaxID=2873249 RepID=A0ABS7R002_9ACTN|nr:hypothetical protein [Streptantibioticus parmotrematis]MBY8888787.1 hypothetical protein [Streptantibioticus parmotrematis]